MKDVAATMIVDPNSDTENIPENDRSNVIAREDSRASIICGNMRKRFTSTKRFQETRSPQQGPAFNGRFGLTG